MITSLDGCAYSAATMIFLAGRKQIISPYCTFMVHNYSGAMVGKGHEISSQLKFTDSFIKIFTNKIYKNFLTQTEIDDVINGKDLWMGAEEVEKRLNKMNKNSEENVLKQPRKTKSHNEKI